MALTEIHVCSWCDWTFESQSEFTAHLTTHPKAGLKQLRGIFVGIDPGKQGAIAFYNPANGELQTVLDMPESLGELVSIFQSRVHMGLLAIVEDVSAMTYVDSFGKTRGQGAAASFAFGKGVGQLQGVLAALGIPVRLVKPSVWKSLSGLSANKDESRAAAKKRFPEWKDKFERKKDDGRAEAALLAVFGAERFYKQ